VKEDGELTSVDRLPWSVNELSLIESLRLMVILDPDHTRGDFGATVRSVLSAGAPSVQVRCKSAAARELFRLAVLVCDEAKGLNTLVIVNDRFDVALAAGADGVHVGPNDLPVSNFRSSCPPGFLIGASSDDPVEAAQLVADGADYIGCGAVFPTSTKSDVGRCVGVDGLAQVVRRLDAPVVGIGGITALNVDEVMQSGCAGVAILSSVVGVEESGRVVREILR
jgi:thiamine-phosphate pyrophosphorylase